MRLLAALAALALTACGVDQALVGKDEAKTVKDPAPAAPAQPAAPCSAEAPAGCSDAERAALPHTPTKAEQDYADKRTAFEAEEAAKAAQAEADKAAAAKAAAEAAAPQPEATPAPEREHRSYSVVFGYQEGAERCSTNVGFGGVTAKSATFYVLRADFEDLIAGDKSCKVSGPKTLTCVAAQTTVQSSCGSVFDGTSGYQAIWNPPDLSAWAEFKDADP